MYETTRESAEEIVLTLKFPSKSVVVPWVVPWKMMLANGIGSPECASVTLPFTTVCAIVLAGTKKNKMRAKNVFRRKNLPLMVCTEVILL